MPFYKSDNTNGAFYEYLLGGDNKQLSVRRMIKRELVGSPHTTILTTLSFLKKHDTWTKMDYGYMRFQWNILEDGISTIQ